LIEHKIVIETAS